MGLMRKLSKLQSMKWFMNMVGLMGLISIPLLIYNLIVAPATDKVFAFTELTTILLLFGSFCALLVGRKPNVK